MRMKKIYMLCVCVCCIASSLSAQVNFFTKETDTLYPSFYARSQSVTLMAVSVLPHYMFGISCFVHNNNDYVSYYVGFATNGAQNKTITAVEKDGSTTMQLRIPFTYLQSHVGMAQGLTRNLFAYIHTGFVYTYSTFTPTHDTYSYADIPQGMNILLGFGVLYVTESKLSFQAGMQSFQRNFVVGIGYTL